jgi:hypothetical protein
MISDPKALQYIYQATGYQFQKQAERRAISEAISGKGIIWADGRKTGSIGVWQLLIPFVLFLQGMITRDTAKSYYPGLAVLNPRLLHQFLPAMRRRYAKSTH